MSLVAQLTAELAPLVPASEILSDQQNARFQEYAKRWTDIGQQIPGAIVLPMSEVDIQQIVRWCVKSSVSFVVRGSGHSQWSTVDEAGIIIDLSNINDIEIFASEHRAILRGSVRAKQLAVALAQDGFFTALGNGNGVGVVAFMLNGGVSVTNQITGYGSDQILAARMIDARGELIEANETNNPDLLWALRGAGQFFGLITELTVRVHPFEALGNKDGTIWFGSFVFPIDRAAEVANAMKSIVNDGRYQTSGLMMVTSPPPKRQPTLVIAARYTGNFDNVQAAYKGLYDLKPLVANGGPIPIQNASDGRAEVGAYGDFKRFTVVGLPQFDDKKFPRMIEIYKAMVEECPDSINSAFMVQWDANLARKPDFESATSLHTTRLWQNNLIWHTDASKRATVDSYDEKCVALMRGPNQAEWQDYQNATRTGLIEHRFRPAKRLDRLRALKERWDPNGIFTRQLLD